MIKQLFLTLLSLVVFATVFAQSKADSAVKAPADTINKMQPDSTVQQHKTDTTGKKALADSMQNYADSTAKQVPVKHHAASPIKHPHTDSVAKVQPRKIDKHASTDNVLKHSTVKTLSDERYTILLKGEDFDQMALAGEMNHYPSPDNALKHKVELGLNPGQLIRLKDISNALHRKKIEMGENIIKNEKMLDTLFQTKQAADGTIIFYTNRYGLYMGEIRNAVLQACLKTRDVLSEAQIKKLEGLDASVK
ncbi:MAG TPA: hypothetical protein VJ844_07675 [Mucilaginibacter sp.]|nr:hypothetical protein [Mucilaginibacter sp.]